MEKQLNLSYRNFKTLIRMSPIRRACLAVARRRAGSRGSRRDSGVNNLENLIYLTIFCLPLYLVRFRVLGVSVNVLDVLVGAVVVSCVLRCVGMRHCPVSTGATNYKKYFFPIGLIFFGLIISTLLAFGGKDASSNVPWYVPNYVHSLGIIKSWFVFPIVFIFITALVIPKEKRLNIFTAYYFSALVVALISLGYLFFGKLTFDGRLAGIFNSPNYLAMYIAPGIIIGIQELSSWRRLRLAWIISLSILLAILYFTYSYAAWVAVAISLLAIQTLRNRINKKYAIVIIILAILFFSQLDNNKFVNLINLNPRSSLSSRLMIWKSAGKIIGDNWLFGIGPGNFQERYLECQKFFPPYLEWAVPHPHNVYLAFWLSGGILALGGFLWLIYLFFRDIFARIKKETRQCLGSTDVLYISLGIMLYILLHGLVDTTVFKNDLAVVFWMCFLAL